MIRVETDISAEWDSRIDWDGLAARALTSAVAHSRHAELLSTDLEVSIKFTDDREVQALNARWRGREKPTNVLSFPMIEASRLGAGGEPMLGDIVLAAGVCAAEAADKRLPLESHASHLVVHGMLHLLGYDHETGEADAEEMEAAERRALAALGIPDPYAIIEVQS